MHSEISSGAGHQEKFNPGLVPEVKEEDLATETNEVKAPSDKNIAGILEGLDKIAARGKENKNFSPAAIAERKAAAEARRLAAINADEEKLWDAKLQLAKQNIAEQERTAEEVKNLDKIKELERKDQDYILHQKVGRVKEKIATRQEERHKFEESLVAEENREWEEKEWEAKKKTADQIEFFRPLRGLNKRIREKAKNTFLGKLIGIGRADSLEARERESREWAKKQAEEELKNLGKNK